MDYISLIADNSKPEELLHTVSARLKKEFTLLTKLLAEEKIYGAAELSGNMAVDIDLLEKIDEKMNGTKKPTIVA